MRGTRLLATFFCLAQSVGPAASGMRQQSYGNLPLYFEPNLGQEAPEVRFMASGPGLTLFLTDAEAVMALGAGEGRASEVRMRLAGASRLGRAVGLQRLPGLSHYFVGDDPKKWVTNIPQYARVRQPSVYPGVDLVYYASQQRLEYDFEIAPGADPARIELQFSGAAGLHLDPTGDLILQTQAGPIRLLRPTLYQPGEHGRRHVEGGYLLEGNRVRFWAGSYDRRRALVIDPVLSFSATLGISWGSYGITTSYSPNDIGEYGALALDPGGNVYVSAFGMRPRYQGDSSAWDVFVAKLSPNGKTLLYKTYLGGTSSDFSNALAVDSAGNAVVVGSTYSTDLALRSPPQASYRGGQDGYLAKLNSAGQVVYSTYLGGTGADSVRAVVLDTGSPVNAYVTGYTCSSDFPTTPGVYQSALNGACDAFVARLNLTDNFVYSTLLGGPNADYGNAIAADSSGSAYVTGYTSGNFPTTRGAYRALPYGNEDVFVTKLRPDGTGLLYSTLLGGTGSDYGYGIAVDASLNAYVTGDTSSGDFPVTPGVVQSSWKGGWDGFVTKLNAAGSAPLYSTYLGGAKNDRARGLAVDGSGNVTVGGTTYSPDFPVFDALQRAKSGAAEPVYSSSNGGTFWIGSSTGISAAGITILRVFSGNPNTVYAVGSNGEVYRSTDGGGAWGYRGKPPGLFSVRDLAVHPADSFTLFAVTLDGLVYSSADGGVTWFPRNNGFPSYPYISAVAISGSNPNVLYAASSSGVYTSVDGGSNWVPTGGSPSGSASSLAIDYTDAAKVYAATGDRIYKTSNGGATWVSVLEGLSYNYSPRLAMDPTNPNVLYVANGCLVYKTVNGGGAWTRVYTGVSNFDSARGAVSLAVDAASPSQVYLGFEGGGLYRSVDGGTTWAPLNANAPFGQQSVGALAIAPLGPSRVLAGLSVSSDLFITKLNATATGLLGSTFLGAVGSEKLGGVKVDSGGATYLALSLPSSSDFPVTPGAYEAPVRHSGDIFVAKLSPGSGGCAVSLSPASGNFSFSDGGSGRLRVLIGSGCSWTATSGASWITLLSTPAGTGLGSLDFAVAANTSGIPRSGSILVNGQPFQITQAGLPGCSLVYNSASVPASESEVTLQFAPSPFVCPLTFSSGVSWAWVKSASSAGIATFGIQANLWTAPRAGALYLGGQAFTVTQAAGAACSAGPISLLSPISASLTTADCKSQWNGNSQYAKQYAFSATAGQKIAVEMIGSGGFDTYLSLLGPDGSLLASNGDYGFSKSSRIPASGGFLSLPATGIYRIEASGSAGNFTVQLLPACEVTLPQLAAPFTSAAGTGSIQVSSGGGCTWTATSYAPGWLTVTSSPTGAGNGLVTYQFPENFSYSTRVGSISIGGQAFNVSQAGSIGGCSFTFLPAAEMPGPGASARTVSLTGSAWYCGWTATSTQGWLTVPPASSLSGSGTIAYTLAANPRRSSRSAQILVGATGFPVTQEGRPGPDAVNPGFEAATLAPWEVHGNPTVSRSSGLAFTGTYSLAESGGTGGGVYQDLSGLTPGQLYHVTARVRWGAGPAPQAFLWVHDTLGGGIAADGPRTPSNTGWDEFAVDFVATSTGKLRIHLDHTGGAGTLNWDDVEVVEGGQQGFERGVLSPWVAAGGVTATVTDAVASSGTFSLAESGGSGGVFLDISGLTPGRYYHVTARARSAASTTGQAVLWVHDTSGANYASDGGRTPSSSDWQSFAVNFAATVTGKLRVYLGYTGGAGTVYWDDLEVVQAWRTGFESGTVSPWVVAGSVSPAVASAVAYSGAFSLVETGGSGGVYLDLGGLTPGQYYRVTARGRSAAGTAAQAQLWVHDTLGFNAVADGWRTPSSSRWEEFAANFVATGAGRLRIHLWSNGGAGTLYWDDVRVEAGWKSGFESGALAPWLVAYGVSASVTSALAYSGSFSLAESGGGGGVYQDISGLVPGQVYRITARVRSAGGPVGQALLWVHDTTGAGQAGDGWRVPSSSGWEEFAANFTATATGKLRIHLWYSGGAGTVYWDEVQVLRTTP